MKNLAGMEKKCGWQLMVDCFLSALYRMFNVASSGCPL